MDILVSKSIIVGDGNARPYGNNYIAWSDLYPFWQEIGYARSDHTKVKNVQHNLKS